MLYKYYARDVLSRLLVYIYRKCFCIVRHGGWRRFTGEHLENLNSRKWELFEHCFCILERVRKYIRYIYDVHIYMYIYVTYTHTLYGMSSLLYIVYYANVRIHTCEYMLGVQFVDGWRRVSDMRCVYACYALNTAHKHVKYI